MAKADSTQNRYSALIERIFADRFRKGATSVAFERRDLETAAAEIGIKLPKNLGDVIYSLRYRSPLPKTILKTQPAGMEWIIAPAGRASYAFKLQKVNRIVPDGNLISIKIPDATPEIISAYAFSDEQALLAKVRYNRLIDIFLGMAAYSLQNHLRTTVKDMGQIEIDEIYVGIDRKGRQFVIPVQAKGGKDQLGAVQTFQDIACCAEKFPNLICRPISAQFISINQIALFELTIDNGSIKKVEERHYCLVPADQITQDDLRGYDAR